MLDVVFITGVAADADDVLGALRLVQVGGEDVRAFGREEASGGAADAGRGAGDDRDLVLEPHHLRVIPAKAGISARYRHRRVRVLRPRLSPG